LDWTFRLNRLTGIALLLFALLTVLSVVLSFGMGDADPIEKEEIAELLTNINDNEAAVVGSVALAVATDAILGFVVAVGLYLTFRGRDRVLALIGFASVIAAGAGFMASDAGRLAMVFLADDFVNGGPEGVGANSAVILEVARAVGITAGLAEQIAATAFGFALLAFGALIAWSPVGTAAAPPRWLGWIAAISGVAFILSWLIAVTESAFVLFIVAGLGALIFFVVLGAWLLARPPEDEGAVRAIA